MEDSMPTTVKQLFLESGKDILGVAKWGQSVECNSPGVYVVAITPDADKMVCFDDAPISDKFIERWINCVPHMTLDNESPTIEALTQRLQNFWLPDETVLYIGKAGTSLKTRVKQYYDTHLGASKPHRGGHWIKVLNIICQLSIYWTTSDNEPANVVEHKFLEVFTIMSP